MLLVILPLLLLVHNKLIYKSTFFYTIFEILIEKFSFWKATIKFKF